MSKEIQIIVTISVTNSEYSLLLNPESGLSLTDLLKYKLDCGSDDVSLDFPALLLDIE